MGIATGGIDAASFAVVRFATGAATLLLLHRVLRGAPLRLREGSWAGAGVLLAYALGFSFAFVTLGAGTGALILFGTAQATMIAAGLRAGERPRAAEWGGLACAVAGVVYLVLPGVTAPSPLGAASMAFAGVAWGVYSLRGRASRHPLTETAVNFVRVVPLLAVAALITHERWSARGVLYATLSGSLASGVGYVIWYAALRGLTATRAATVQLAVPLIAATAGVLLLDERVTLRLGLAAALILGGIGAAVTRRPPPS